jgi:hypothetical protein
MTTAGNDFAALVGEMSAAKLDGNAPRYAHAAFVLRARFNLSIVDDDGVGFTPPYYYRLSNDGE